jgi:hypothetical protein
MRDDEYISEKAAFNLKGALARVGAREVTGE